MILQKQVEKTLQTKESMALSLVKINDSTRFKDESNSKLPLHFPKKKKVEY